MVAALVPPQNVQQAHYIGNCSLNFLAPSFDRLFYERIADPELASLTYLTYHNDAGGVRSYTYQEFGQVVQQWIAYMREQLGVQRGDRLAILLCNHDVTVALYFAAWVMGAVVVPIDVKESPERRLYILEHSEACTAFCWQDLYEEIQDVRNRLPHLRHVMALGREADLSPENLRPPYPSNTSPSRSTSCAPLTTLQDDALIIYTSGTTGPPKGVVLTMENLLVDAHGIAEWHGLEKGHRLMCVLPLHHVNGIVVTLLTPFYAKGTAVLNRRFRQAQFWSLIEQEGVTCVSVVPTILEFLLESASLGPRHVPRHLRGMICGAGPLVKDTVQRFEKQFQVPIRHGYGLSETTCYSSFLPIDLSPQEHAYWLTHHEYPSIGVPIPYNQMAILNQHGEAVAEKEKGEICIKGPTVCSGYLKRPDANQESFQWGWFRSGDEGFFIRDESGRPFYFISGRIKELIIRGGVNYSPLEIDEVLKSHPSVKFGMAVSFENRYYGEEIAGYLVLKEQAPRPSEEEMLTWCRGKLPFAKCPKLIVFGEEVPYTSTGKPKRLALRARLSPELTPYRDVRFTPSLLGSRQRNQPQAECV